MGRSVLAENSRQRLVCQVSLPPDNVVWFEHLIASINSSPKSTQSFQAGLRASEKGYINDCTNPKVHLHKSFHDRLLMSPFYCQKSLPFFGFHMLSINSSVLLPNLVGSLTAGRLPIRFMCQLRMETLINRFCLPTNCPRIVAISAME